MSWTITFESFSLNRWLLLTVTNCPLIVRLVVKLHGVSWFVSLAEWQKERVMSTINLLNIIDLRTTLLTGTLRSTNYFQRLNLKSWYTDSPKQVSITIGFIQTTYVRYLHLKRSEQYDLTVPTYRNWLITTDLRQLSLKANNITAKVTLLAEFTRTGL